MNKTLANDVGHVDFLRCKEAMAVVFLQGKDEHGAPLFVYAACKVVELDSIRQAMEAGKPLEIGTTFMLLHVAQGDITGDHATRIKYVQGFGFHEEKTNFIFNSSKLTSLE